MIIIKVTEREVVVMESCWTDDDDLCDLRSDAALLRLLAMEMELGGGGGLAVDTLRPAQLHPAVHWALGALYTVTGIIKGNLCRVLNIETDAV